MRRWPVVVAVLLVCALVSVAHAAEKVTITHLSSTAHSDSWQQFLHEMAELFEQAYPHYEVDIQVGNLDNFLVMAAGGISPDVLDLPTHGAGTAAADGLFLDIGKFLAREPHIAERIPQAMLDALTTPDGILFMLPVEVYSIVTWYNLDMINEAGLTPPADLGDDWDWATMREYGRKLTKRTGDGVVEVWGIDRIRSRPYIQVLQAGGSFFDRDIFPTESLLLSEPVITAIEFIEQLLWEDQVSHTPGVAASYLYHGKAAVDVVDGPGIIGTNMRNVTFNWDVAPQPYGPANNATNVSLNGFEISAQSAHPEAAWEWVKFIGTTEDAQRRFAQHTGRLPVMREVAQIWDQLLPVPLPNNWTAFFEQSIHPENIFLKEGIVKDDRIITVLNQQLNRVWQGQTSTRLALEEADRQIRQFLAESN